MNRPGGMRRIPLVVSRTSINFTAVLFAMRSRVSATLTSLMRLFGVVDQLKKAFGMFHVILFVL